MPRTITCLAEAIAKLLPDQLAPFPPVVHPKQAAPITPKSSTPMRLNSAA